MNKTNNLAVSIIVADYNATRMHNIVEILQKNTLINVVGIADTGMDVVNRASKVNVDAVLIEYSMTDCSAIEVAERLRKCSPNTYVFAISDIEDDKFTFRLKKAGIVETFARKGFVASEAGEIIYQYIYNKRLESIGMCKKIEPNPQETIVKDYAAREIPQSIITIFNSKGGVGKSSVAANLATAIKMSPYMTEQRVAIIDFDTVGANLATILHISDEDASNRNLAFWNGDLSNLSMQDVDDLMIKGPHGIMALPAPADISLAGKVNYELCQNIIITLKKYFKIIVIDGSPALSSSMDVALTNATHILLTANAEGQSVKQLDRTLNLLSPDPSQPDKPDMTHILCKMFLILNHAQGDSKWDLTANEVASAVGRPLIGELPFSEDVRQSLHDDSNLQAVDINPDSEYSKAMKNLANTLVGAYPDGIEDNFKIKNTKSKGFLGGLFSLFKRN